MKKLSLVLALVLFGAMSLLAQRAISGKIVDTNNEPLVGATILVKGTSAGTASDVNGEFSLNVPESGTTLVISYTGFSDREIALSGESNYLITMEADITVLEDVVVVGYGTASKKELTGSVAKVSGDVISKLPVTGVDQALQGQAPGIQVTSASGTPGASVSVRVRGPSSITASNQPLYVIDGIPVNNNNLSQLGFGGQQDNPLANLNPSDIESIEILKDAAAAAIYGSRASNGVVLITTKRGKQQQTAVNLSTYYGTQDVWRTLETLTGPEFGALNNEMRAAAGLSQRYADPSTLANTFWQDEIFRSAPISNTDISFSGGNERTKFFVSASYFLQDGIVRGSGFERYSARVNLDNLVSDKFKIGTSTSLSRASSNRINNDNNIFGVVSTAILVGPHIPVFNADGTYARDPFNSIENPVAAAVEPTNENNNDRLLTNIFGEYEFLPWLSFRTSFSLDFINFKEFRFNPTTTNAGAGTKGSGFIGTNQNLTWINENYFTIRKAFGDFNLDALLGASFQHSNIESSFVQGDNFPGNTIKSLNAASIYRNITSNLTEWGLNSFFSRLNLNYNQKYFISASLRADGSSRFGANNRWGVFPAVSAAWRISEEGFLKDNSLVSDLKLRASWGIRGNQELGNFQSLALIAPGFNYNQSAGLAPNQLGNPDLTWEEREDIGVGLDIGLFRDRLTINLDWYQGTTNELLLNRPLVFTSGYANITENIGSIRNTGIDVGITSVNFQTDKFTWTTNFNISTFENEILKISGTPFAAGFASWVEAGQPLGAFRGHRVVKIFQDQAEIDALNAKAKEMTGSASAVYQSTATRPGDLMFADLNGNGTITADDQEILGDANPDFFGGITNNLSGFGFDLSFFFQFSLGNEVWNHTRVFAEGMNGQFGQFATVRERWTVDNPTTDIRYPRAIWGDPNNNRRNSDRWLEDGSYIRLKNITLGYTLPKNIVGKIGLSNVRIYATGQNLITITDYSGFDPEVSTFGEVNLSQGTDFLTFPQARTILFGLNVGF